MADHPVLDDGRHFTEREPWEYWDGSYGQAYSNGYNDATNHPPINIPGDPYPTLSLIEAWQTLGGYLMQSHDDGILVDGAEVLELMHELKDKAYADVYAWWERNKGPDGLPVHEDSRDHAPGGK